MELIEVIAAECQCFHQPKLSMEFAVKNCKSIYYIEFDASEVATAQAHFVTVRRTLYEAGIFIMWLHRFVWGACSVSENRRTGIRELYHATPISNLDNIRRYGLKPSSRSNYDRWDSIGNIYAMPALGESERPCEGSAHYLLTDLRRRKGSDEKWCILQVPIAEPPIQDYFPDPFSGSGSSVLIYTETPITGCEMVWRE